MWSSSGCGEPNDEGPVAVTGPPKMERKTGFEPATTTLARWSSTGLSYFRTVSKAGAIYREVLRTVKPVKGVLGPRGKPPSDGRSAARSTAVRHGERRVASALRRDGAAETSRSRP